MDKSQLKKMTKQELVDLARTENLSGYSRLNKDELVDFIAEQVSLSNQNDSTSTASKTKSKAQTKQNAATAVMDYKDQAEKSRYYLGEIHEEFREDQFNFPTEYGKTRIVLMVRDPYWMHTYWEVTFQKIEELKHLMGEETFNESTFTLRVKDTTNASADMPNSYFDIHISPGSKSWYINVPNDNAAYVVDIGFRTSDGRFFLAARSNSVSVPRATVSDVIDDEFTSIDAAEFDKIYALSGGLNIGMSSAELHQMMKERIEQSISSGAFSGAVSSWSSGGGGVVKKEKKERSFFLVVNTELIVYGATVPDAELTIQGKPKKLNPDGTFTARFALPDGLQEIPVKAISSDKIDEITITPIVSKKTV